MTVEELKALGAKAAETLEEEFGIPGLIGLDSGTTDVLHWLVSAYEVDTQGTDDLADGSFAHYTLGAVEWTTARLHHIFTVKESDE